MKTLKYLFLGALTLSFSAPVAAQEESPVEAVKAIIQSNAPDAEKQIKVQIQKLTSPKNYLLNTSVAANCEADLLFSVEDGWGEYKLTITRPSSSDVITITDIVINTTNEDVTAIHTSVAPTPSETTVYTLSGIKASQTPRHGAVLIKNNKKILTP
jgi:hypothetical protein